MPGVLDIEQALLLLELEPAVRQARGAARAPPAGQGLAPRHRAAGQAVRARAPPQGDQRGGRPARAARRGLARRPRLAQRGQGQRRRGARRAGRGGPPRLRGRAARARRATRTARKHDPFGSRMPDHSVVHRYARCLSYPEWGVGSVTGIYFTGAGRRRAAVGARQVRAPACAPCPAGHAAVRRLLQARPGRRARPALPDRRPARDGRGRLRARRAAPRSTRATPSRATSPCCG